MTFLDTLKFCIFKIFKIKCLKSEKKLNFLARVNCPCPEQGLYPNSQLSSAIFAPILPTEPEDHDQTIHRVPVNELIVLLWVELKQILHLKVDCSDLGPVRDRGSLP